MSLNEIRLSPYLLSQLYPNALVEGLINSNNKPAKNKPDSIVNVPALQALGNNKKNITIGVSYQNVAYLPDEQLEFLIQLLKACKLGIDDIALINLSRYSNMEYEEILNYFKTNVIILFGITGAQFGFPFDTPQYQVQNFAAYTVMHAPPLHQLQHDKSAKTILWGSLKKIFSL